MENKKWDLATIQSATNAIDIYKTGNIEKLIGDLEDEVRSIVPDLTTNKGRKEIASLAYKVSRSKTVLDNLGKELVGERKKEIKLVDINRKLMRDRFDELRDEVRAPLTKYEEQKEKRIAKEKLDNEINESHGLAIPENELFDKNKEAERLRLEEEAARLKAMEAQQAELDARQAELDKKQAEIDAKEAAQKQADHEAALKKEAAETAKCEAEQKAQAEIAAEKKKAQDEIDAANKRERAQKEALEIAKREATETESRVKREVEEAAQLEIDEAEKREADTKHKASVNNAAVKALIAGGVSETVAKKAITLIAQRKIPAVVISY